jgi:drug/metabolite transporter (DMT)-like permease
MPNDSRSLSDVAIFCAPALFVVLWASGFVGAKLGLPYAEPMTFLAIRMGAVVVLIAIVTAVTRPVWPNSAGVVHSIITGLLVHGCYLGGVFFSIDHKLPAGLSALVVSLQPVLTSTLANRLLGEPVAFRQWLGLGLGLLGVYFVVHDRASGEAPVIAWIGATVALIGMTAGTLYQKRFGAVIDWRPGFLIQYAAACILFSILAFVFETRAVQWTAEFAIAVAWLVFALSFGAVWLLYFLIRRQAATRVVSLFYLTPPFTALMAWLMFGETLSGLAIVGMAVCAAGVALVNWRVGQPSKQLNWPGK